jgi:hypothetical protein
LEVISVADEATIARFRRMTALAADDAVYTDSVIDGMIEDLGFEAAAASVWREKAAGAAGLVDTTESGSSRKLSQLYDQYLAMGGVIGGDTDTGGGSYTVEIERV